MSRTLTCRDLAALAVDGLDAFLFHDARAIADYEPRCRCEQTQGFLEDPEPCRLTTELVDAVTGWRYVLCCRCWDLWFSRWTARPQPFGTCDADIDFLNTVRRALAPGGLPLPTREPAVGRGLPPRDSSRDLGSSATILPASGGGGDARCAGGPGPPTYREGGRQDAGSAPSFYLLTCGACRETCIRPVLDGVVVIGSCRLGCRSWWQVLRKDVAPDALASSLLAVHLGQATTAQPTTAILHPRQVSL